jgi:alginate O-acetyltransferase complex protein AlgJ
MPRARNVSLVLAFAAVLLAPTVATIFHLDPFGAIEEKRGLAPRPEHAPWSQPSLRQVPAAVQAWEKYFNDHFGLRKLLLGSYRWASYHLLRTSPNPAVVLGESDGHARWLYFDAAAMGEGAGFDAFLGKTPYTAAELARLAERLKAATAQVRKSGAKLIIAISPAKQTIYPEYLPRDKRPRPGYPSRLDQFWAMAAGLDGVPLLDLRVPLWQAKSEGLLYYPSDTHWNIRGGMLAYVAIARALAAQDPTRAVLPVERLQWQMAGLRPGDLVALMGVPGVSGDQNWLPTPASYAALTGTKRGKLLVIGDSFFEAIQLFMAKQFESVRSIYVSRGPLEALQRPGLLEAERPDVVIVQSAERFWTLE